MSDFSEPVAVATEAERSPDGLPGLAHAGHHVLGMPRPYQW
jgi:hypothetical protein